MCQFEKLHRIFGERKGFAQGQDRDWQQNCTDWKDFFNTFPIQLEVSLKKFPTAPSLVVWLRERES